MHMRENYLSLYFLHVRTNSTEMQKTYLTAAFFEHIQVDAWKYMKEERKRSCGLLYLIEIFTHCIDLLDHGPPND